MALLTGILMVGVLWALIALLVHRTKTNLTTFIVALILWLFSAIVASNNL